MKNQNRSAIETAARAAAIGLSAVLLSAAFGGRSAAQSSDRYGDSHPGEHFGQAPATPGGRVEGQIRDWPEGARTAARAMIDKYGQPTRSSEGALVWIDNGPWAKTVVYRNARSHYAFKRDKDYLEQSVAYRVPEEKIAELKRFDRRLVIRAGLGQLSARSESEALNLLALNLADEIVTDKRTVADARDFYRKTERLAESGKSSPYLDGLLFSQSSNMRSPADDRIDTDYDRNLMP